MWCRSFSLVNHYKDSSLYWKRRSDLTATTQWWWFLVAVFAMIVISQPSVHSCRWTDLTSVTRDLHDDPSMFRASVSDEWYSRPSFNNASSRNHRPGMQPSASLYSSDAMRVETLDQPLKLCLRLLTCTCTCPMMGQLSRAFNAHIFARTCPICSRTGSSTTSWGSLFQSCTTRWLNENFLTSRLARCFDNFILCPLNLYSQLES